jgi:hypothetical protein
MPAGFQYIIRQPNFEDENAQIRRRGYQGFRPDRFAALHCLHEAHPY